MTRRRKHRPEILSDSARRRIYRVLTVAAVVLLGANAAVLLTGATDGEVERSAPATTIYTPTTFATTTSTTVPHGVAASTPVAAPKGDIPTFDGPGGNPLGRAGFWYGRPQTMPIVEENGEWLRIMLPDRPNESTAWVRADDVERDNVDWHLVVVLSEFRLYVYRDGIEQWTSPLGIGRDGTRTPTGSFYVANKEFDVPGGYGPVVIDLSASSEDIQSWAGSGDAVIAFHGPFGQQSTIAAGGAKMSNGCMRMTTEDQLKLADIPVGTPVNILS